MNGISLSHRQYTSIDRDHRKAAKAVNLSYITDRKEGIRRQGGKRGFSYSYKGKPVRNKRELARIKKLAIPPSWSTVWICPSASGHLQATGLDLNGRKQYRYHSQWSQVRNETKFHRLVEFGKALPALRRKINKDLGYRQLVAEKVIAAAIRLMEQTSIRIGNNEYEKLYGSYGLTTLKDKHVSIRDDKAIFSFTGKKGIEHKITLKNKKLTHIIKQCRDIPGKELFQYYDKNGVRNYIDSGMVNEYIKIGTRGDFSAKDFRTWTASLEALQCFCAAGEATGNGETKKKVAAVLDEVSNKLGNTRTICKKYYVHPLLIRLYEENKLPASVLQANGMNGSRYTGLSKNERVLMSLLTRYR